MGLTIVVGALAGFAADDRSVDELFRDQFTRVNRALHHAKLHEHHEPEAASEGLPWVGDLGDFTTLHYLRRLAAYVCLRDDLPQPGDDDAAVDPINEQWCMWATNQQPGTIAQLIGDRAEKPVEYEHLMVHSDANGFYVPQQFHRVIIAPSDYGILGEGLIGSSQSLRDDCARIAAVIDLPLDVDPCSDEMRDAVANQGRASDGWQRFGRESFCCLTLYQAAVKSVESGCALVFC